MYTNNPHMAINNRLSMYLPTGRMPIIKTFVNLPTGVGQNYPRDSL